MADEVTQSRDAEVAGRIASTDIALVALCTDTKNMIDHAERNNAYGHARLYEQVHNALIEAHGILLDAHRTMDTGDPTDYALETD